MSAPEYSEFQPTGSAPTAPSSSIPASAPGSGPTVQSNGLCQLLTWKNPIATGKVFGSIVGVLVLLKINVLSKLFYLAYIVFLVSAAAEYAGKLVTGEGFVTKYKGSKATSYSGFVDDSVLPALSKGYKCLENKVQRIVFAQDIELTLKTAGVAYIASNLTSWFSLYTLVFAFVVLAFTVPPVYVSNKKDIDAAVAHYSKVAKEKSSELTDQAHTAIAPHLDTLVQKTGPVGQFVKSKFPTRTAGSTVGGARGYDEPIVEKPFEGAGSAAPDHVSTGATSGSSFPSVPSSAPKTLSEEPLPEAATGAAPVAVKKAEL